VSNVLAEVVNDRGQPCSAGQAGRLLVSGLHQWASPLLRYDLGDHAAMEPRCTCGAQVPVLSGLVGRKIFLFKLPDGRRRPAYVRAGDWLAVAPVRQHRLIQETTERVRVELVLAHPLDATGREAIVALLSRIISPDLHYDIQEVDAIVWPPGAKRQDVMSLVP
jgi:phenylacetate-CoA ligase